MKIKVLSLVIVSMILVFGLAFATQPQGSGGDSNANAESESHSTAIASGGDAHATAIGNGGKADSKSSVFSVIDNNVKNTNNLKQTQVGIQDNNQKNKQDVTVQGDSTSVKSTAFGAPSLATSAGSEPLQAFSILGGIGTAQTEEYKVCVEKLTVIKQLQDAGYLTANEAVIEARNAYAQLKESSKPKRMLGFLWKSRGRDLSNLFGTLAWSSVYREGTLDTNVINKDKIETKPKKAIVKSEPRPKTEDKGITGNAGNLPGGIQN